MKKYLMLVLAVATFSYFADAEEVYEKLRRDQMKDVLEATNSSRDIPNEDWSLVSIFFDFDADSKEEFLVALKENRGKSGCSWRVFHRLASGKLREYETPISCHPFEFYSIETTSARPKLVIRNLYYLDYDNYMEAATNQVYQYDPDAWAKKIGRGKIKDVFLSLEDQCIRPNPIPGELDSWIWNDSFRKLSSIRSAYFEGYNHRGFAGSPPIEMKPFRDTKSASPELKGLMKRYREKIKAARQVNEKVKIFAIPLDANGDGHEDAYVTSDLKRKENDTFVWHLYLNNGNAYSPAKDRIFINRVCKNPNIFVEILDPKEIATKKSFYSANLGSFNPAIVIYDFKDGKLTSHSYQKLLTERERKSRPEYMIDGNVDRELFHKFEDWEFFVRERLGFYPPFTFREIISNSSFNFIERLPCFEDVE